ncbi:hypothetical protein MCOR14_000610 [Pyricularia oryzae]|nr:hypothetical protein MCOR14_000610 [Pyricularia oryzae]
MPPTIYQLFKRVLDSIYLQWHHRNTINVTDPSTDRRTWREYSGANHHTDH